MYIIILHAHEHVHMYTHVPLGLNNMQSDSPTKSTLKCEFVGRKNLCDHNNLLGSFTGRGLIFGEM